MNKNICKITILKTKHTHRCFLNEEELSTEQVFHRVTSYPPMLVKIETIENERLLLSGYFVYTNKKTFHYNFKQAQRGRLYL